MRYRLRTLLIVLALGPIVLAEVFFWPEAWGLALVVAAAFMIALAADLIGRLISSKG
jgi:hypothetical protein